MSVRIPCCLQSASTLWPTVLVATLALMLCCASTLTATLDGDAQPPSEQGASGATEERIIVRPFEDITVYPEEQRLEIRAWTCLEAGYLEQIACAPGTREHESLVVIRAKPSNIHAALLMAGFEAGRPGQWALDAATEELDLIPPSGDAIDVWFQYERDGAQVIESARSWIRDHHDQQAFPNEPWIFSGSIFKPNPEWMGPGEHYVADMTGSIIGLVTFGDELIGFREVISDQAAIHEPEWKVHTKHVPPEGTEVTVILLPYGQRPEGATVCDDAGVDDDKSDDEEAEPGEGGASAS